jgi:hypothetical protein
MGGKNKYSTNFEKDKPLQYEYDENKEIENMATTSNSIMTFLLMPSLISEKETAMAKKAKQSKKYLPDPLIEKPEKNAQTKTHQDNTCTTFGFAKKTLIFDTSDKVLRLNTCNIWFGPLLYHLELSYSVEKIRSPLGRG